MGRISFTLDLISPQALLGLSRFYNAEWWYVSQYFTMLALFPIFDFILCHIFLFVQEKIIKRHKHGQKIVFTILLGLGIIFALFRNSILFSWFIPQLNNGRFVFTLVFFVGYLCAYFHLFEFGANNILFQKLRPFISILFIIVCVGIRYIRAYDAVYCKYDAFITTPLVYAVCTLLSYLKIVPALLRKIGKYSTYIWLTHSFFCFYYFSHVIVKAQISTLMFILLTIISLLTAYLLTEIEKAIPLFISRNKTA